MELKKKILFVAADPPMPPTGGGLRTMHLLKGLVENNVCHLYLLFKINKKGLPDFLLNSCKDIRISTVPFSSPKVSFWKKIFIGLEYILFPNLFPTENLVKLADYFAGNPFKGNNLLKRVFYNLQRKSVIQAATKKYHNGYYYPARTLERFSQFSEMKKEIFVEMQSSDILWIDFSYLLIFFNEIKSSHKGLKIVCNAHNLEFKYLESLASFATDELEKNWQILQMEVMKKIELNGFAECNLVLVCSEIEMNTLLEINPSLSIKVVPNGVDLDFFRTKTLIKSEPVILFTGNMNYIPNKDAVHYFVQSIFPGILKVRPDSKFYIAGFNAGGVFPEYLNHRNIVIATSPKDMRVYYNKAHVVVVPIRMGSGTRLKILEAMAMKKPIVSTALGAEGLNFIQNEDLLVAGDERDFSNLVLELLNESEFANRLSNNAYMKLEKNYSWREIEKSVSTLIMHLN